MIENKQIKPSDLNLEQLVKDCSEDIGKRLKQKAIESLTQSCSWQFNESVKEAVADFFTKEIVPELEKHLKNNTNYYLEQMILAIDDLSKVFRETLITEMKDSLSKSWNREKLIKTLVGG